MRTPQDQRIDPVFQQIVKVTHDDLVRHAVMHPSLLDERNKQRPRLAEYPNIRIDPADRIGIRMGMYRSSRGNDTDLPVPGRLGCHSRSRLDHTDHRHAGFLTDLIDRERGRGIAGNHDRLDILCFQKAHDLAGIPHDRIL